jgi:hypothetical protein
MGMATSAKRKKAEALIAAVMSRCDARKQLKSGGALKR